MNGTSIGRMMRLIPNATATFVTPVLLLLLIKQGVEVLSFQNGVDPLQWQRHRRFYPPRVPHALTGHGMRYIQKPHINPASFRQPHLNYNRMTHIEGYQGSRHRPNVWDHLGGFSQNHPGLYLHGEPLTGWGLLKGAISRRIDDLLERSGVSRTLFYSSVDSWYNAFESTLKRDAVYNIGKVGGILILYYFFPGVLSWLSNTFGAV